MYCQIELGMQGVLLKWECKIDKVDFGNAKQLLGQDASKRQNTVIDAHLSLNTWDIKLLADTK